MEIWILVGLLLVLVLGSCASAVLSRRRSVSEWGGGRYRMERDANMFILRDKAHEFCISLKTILQCIFIAEAAGALPRMKDDWVEEVLSAVKGRSMVPEIKEEPLFSEAKLVDNVIIDHTSCEKCMENYLFSLEDDSGEIVISLRILFVCLIHAMDEGMIQQIDNKWLMEAANSFS